MSYERISIVVILIVTFSTVLGTDALAHHVERELIGGADYSHHYLAGSPTLNWNTGEIRVDLDHPASYLYLDKVLVYEQGFRDSVSMNGAGQRQGSDSFVIYIELTDDQIEKLRSFNPVGKLELSPWAIRNDDGSHNRRVMYTVTTVEGTSSYDTTPPTLTLIGQSTVSISVGSSYSDAGATCTDTVDGAIQPTVQGAVKPSVPGTYTLTYSCSDGAGNNAVSVSRTIKVSDTTPPTLTLIGQSTVSISVGSSYSDAGATCTDTVDGAIQPTVQGAVKPSVPGTYTLTYSCSDGAGNNAVSVSRTIKVSDTTPPTLTLIGQSTVSISVGSSYSDAGATCTDTVDGAIQPTVQGAVKPSVPGTYTLTYSCSDGAGNNAVSVSRTIKVSDTTPPTLTLIGQSTVSISVGSSYSDAGATCTDTVDGAIQPTVQGAVKPSVPGTYTLTYSCSDGAGNNAVSVSRTIKVSDTTVSDTTPPTLTLIGQSTVSISVGSSYSDAGATCTDTVDGAIQPTVQGAVKPSVPGTYTLTYSCSDGAGNNAVSVSRTIKVSDTTVSDTTPPTLTLIGQSTVSISVGSSYSDAGATCTDTVDGAVQPTVQGAVKPSVPGTYTLTYSCSDGAGNNAVSVSRTIKVSDTTVSDTTPPTLTLIGQSTVSISVGSSYSDAGATCTDTVDGAIQPTVQGAVKPSVPGTYTLTYSCSDGAGNNAVSVSRTIKVSDTTVSDTTPPTYNAQVTPHSTTPSYTVPSAPKLTVVPEDSGVVLSWLTPSSNGGRTITDYTIEYRAEGGSWSVYADGTSITASATVTGLTDGTIYEFRVSAVNAMGTGSPSNVVSTLYTEFDITTDSDDILLNTLSISPRFTNFLVAPDNGRVTLSWNASQMEGQNATGYIVQYREHTGFWQNFLYWDSSSSIIITNLTNNVVYDFRIIPITDLVIDAVAEHGVGIPTSIHTANTTTMNIGVIVSSTGALANEGQVITEVIHYAVDEFNRYLEMHNRAWRLGIWIYNDDSSASGGLNGVSAFNDAGIKTVVGPATSASLDGAMEYIYDNNMLVMSYGSTAPTLAHDDTVFRTTIDDSNTAKVYAAALQHDGISHVISVIRDDVWGVALNDALRASLTNSSIVLDEIKYHPNTTEYDEVIEQIQHSLRPDSTTAVVVFSFEEIKDIVDTAMLHEPLSKIKWYHSDTDIDFILDNNTRREFMSVVNFTTITPIPPKNEINLKINQIVPNADLYSYAAYDAIQIIGKTFDELGLLANTTTLADAIPTIASTHQAALGNTTLNDAGDLAYSDYVVDTVIDGKKTTTHKYILVDGSYYSIIYLPDIVAE